MNAFANIEIRKSDGLAYLVINRPELRNALNKETLTEMMEALEILAADDETGCVVFTGSGEKSFAAGADISQLKSRTALDVFNRGGMQQVYDYIEAYDKPTIAMVNGFALGGGCELAMACDIRIASEHAKFGLPELNLSIIPSAGGTQRLARLVGKGVAMDMILRGKIIDAKEAYRIGLVSEIAEAGELLGKTEEAARQILSKGPLAVKLAKLAVHAGFDADQKTGLVIEKLAQAVLFSTDDKNEGTSAFLEKRKPEFTSK
ncbi:enoyl-CoA hydratase/isomerase family protein [Peribacillus frigoritolerans]|uniref:enoyl-CoA hydratase/isomerase family protein n=1 Tax=Peribacillus frigoritolerans TaxID=450367 RepID=UPI00105A6324|nr:enoyl-CoA hydratase-related protein [Peribacillus frigoritolerans]TDL80374.1 enoyl-CoA hydratase/isomerase family protein [Peribacillus frigoritolerans]